LKKLLLLLFLFKMFALLIATTSACSNQGFANFLAATKDLNDATQGNNDLDKYIWGALDGSSALNPLQLQLNGASVGKLTDAIDGMCEGREKYCVKKWVQDYAQNLGGQWASYFGRFDECMEQPPNPCDNPSTRAEAQACGLMRGVARGVEGRLARKGRSASRKVGRMMGMMRCMDECYEEFGDDYGFREDGEPSDDLELFCWRKCQ